MRDALRASLVQAQRAYRLRALNDAVMMGCAVAGFIAAIALPGAAIVGLIAFLAAAGYSWRTWTLRRTAEAIESQSRRAHNLIVTAEEALRGRHIHPLVAGELFAQANTRLRNTRAVSTRSFAGRFAAAAAMLAATGLLIARGGPVSPGGSTLAIGDSNRTTNAPAASVRAYITPPAYSGRAASIVDAPVQLSLLEGTRVRVDVDGTTQIDLVATASRVLLVRTGDTDRLLHLQVTPDTPPRVVIEKPARDLLFAEARGSIPVSITAQDDIGVRSVTLRYTRIAGSGETFTFEEGDLPLQITAVDPTTRLARGAIVLDQLKLEDGDTLVYRAFARDDKPGADPVASDSFLVEIGKRADAASTGFAVPEDRDRQALSQQMVIVKTERLHSQRETLSPEALLEQSRLLAVEQRMVRAAFLFLTGGEVVDEVEEAEHSHELAAGRLENEGQVELLNAIREMSRAEARLNAADTAQALVFERSALTALQRAFDRRRYFLRTLPERARIDVTRRLSGDLSGARSTTRASVIRPRDPRAEAVRQALLDLAAAAQERTGLDARLAARVSALDPEFAELQQAAIRISTSATIDEKVAAASAAQLQLRSLLRKFLGAPDAGVVRPDPVAGALAEQLSKQGARR